MSLLLQKMYKRTVKKMCRELPSDQIPVTLRVREELRAMEAELDRQIYETQLALNLQKVREALRRRDRRAKKRRRDTEDRKRKAKWTVTEEQQKEILKEVLENPLAPNASRASPRSSEH